MSEPVRRSYSEQELLQAAARFMNETFGSIRESEDRERWHERFGILIHFCGDLWLASPVQQTGDKP